MAKIYLKRVKSCGFCKAITGELCYFLNDDFQCTQTDLKYPCSDLRRGSYIYRRVEWKK